MYKTAIRRSLFHYLPSWNIASFISFACTNRRNSDLDFSANRSGRTTKDGSNCQRLTL